MNRHRSKRLRAVILAVGIVLSVLLLPAIGSAGTEDGDKRPICTQILMTVVRDSEPICVFPPGRG